MDQSGINVILYFDFIDETDRLPEHYTGSTTCKFKIRDEEHSNDVWTTDLEHYQTARKASGRIFCPICYLEPNETDAQDMNVVEQVFADLFQTYSPAVGG